MHTPNIYAVHPVQPQSQFTCVRFAILRRWFFFFGVLRVVRNATQNIFMKRVMKIIIDWEGEGDTIVWLANFSCSPKEKRKIENYRDTIDGLPNSVACFLSLIFVFSNRWIILKTAAAANENRLTSYSCLSFVCERKSRRTSIANGQTQIDAQIQAEGPRRLNNVLIILSSSHLLSFSVCCTHACDALKA